LVLGEEPRLLLLRADEEANVERVFVDVCVQYCVFESTRRVRIDEDTRRAFFDDDVPVKRLALDRVVPGLLVERRRWPGRNAETCRGSGILRDDDVDDSTRSFRR
jgi:hypothetical protein